MDNLIWNWNTASYNEWSKPVDDFYPGDDYVEMVSVDIYDSFKPSYYEDTVRVSRGKPIAIGEAGPLPDIEFLRQNQPLYTYFLGWGKFYDSYSTEGLIDAYHHSNVANQKDIKRSLIVRQMSGQ